VISIFSISVTGPMKTNMETKQPKKRADKELGKRVKAGLPLAFPDKAFIQLDATPLDTEYGKISDRTGRPKIRVVRSYRRKDETYVRGYDRSE
jgi:hypothetical protein